MARDQNLSLSPSKISGLCGRLMCCLAFEENFYRIQSELLPEEGAIIELEGIQYEVLTVDLFNENFVLKGGDGTEKTLNVGEFADYIIIKHGDKTQSDLATDFTEDEMFGEESEKIDESE